METNKRLKVQYLQLRPQQISVKTTSYLSLLREKEELYFLKNFKERVKSDAK